MNPALVQTSRPDGNLQYTGTGSRGQSPWTIRQGRFATRKVKYAAGFRRPSPIRGMADVVFQAGGPSGIRNFKRFQRRLSPTHDFAGLRIHRPVAGTHFFIATTTDCRHGRVNDGFRTHWTSLSRFGNFEITSFHSHGPASPGHAAGRLQNFQARLLFLGFSRFFLDRSETCLIFRQKLIRKQLTPMGIINLNRMFGRILGSKTGNAKRRPIFFAKGRRQNGCQD
jgi:hypothetical protein